MMVAFWGSDSRLSLSFSGANATAGGQTSPIFAFPFTALGLDNSLSELVAAPGPLAAGGSGFTVTYDG